MNDAELVAAVVDEHYGALWPNGAWLPEPVPHGMAIGPPNDDGWVQWKPLASPVTEEQLRQAESELPAPFPAAMRAYFQYRCVLATEGLLLPEVPAGDPLGPFLEEFRAWQPLAKAGYVAFAEYGDGYGPVCLDTHAPCGSDDFAVVWIDHDEIHGLLQADITSRAALASLAKPLFPSFRDLLRALQQGATFPR